MTKTIYEIQEEMETVKLIKDALDVSGERAHDLLKEWTGEEVVIEDDDDGESDIPDTDDLIKGLDELDKVLKSLGFEEKPKTNLVDDALNQFFDNIIKNLNKATIKKSDDDEDDWL